jgi:type I restriction enzyme, S subunit
MKTPPSTWRACRLDEIGSVGRGKSRHRPRNDPALYGGRYPFFQTGDVKAADLHLHEYSQTYNEAGLAQSKLWETGTLCITIAANIADTAILRIRGCFPDSVVGFVADPAKADVRFIKYFIDTIKLRMQNISRGTTQDNLSLDKLLSFDFVIPAVEHQRKIASVLSAYDDLIENNNRRIKILEEMAQNLYREWFVKFRFPGHENNRMVDSPLGEIPEGWEVKALEELCAGKKGIQTGPFGSQLHQADYTEQGVPVVMPKNLLSYRIAVAGIARIPEALAEELVRHRMQPGDICYGRRGDIGRRAFVAERQSGWLCGTGCLRIRPSLAAIEPRYLFDALGSPDTLGLIAGRAKGATMPNLNTSLMASVPVSVPPRDLMGRYVSQSELLAEMIEVLTEGNQNLRQTRDLLLPKLISGEVELREDTTGE